MSLLAVRNRQPELMDDPDLDEELHRQALIGLRRVNWISGTVGTLWRPIQKLAKETDGPIRVLDVACGGGDNVIALSQRAKRSGLDVEVSGCDLSPTAIEIARSNADEKNVSAEFFTADALVGLPNDYDVICCSLFLHHLDEEDVVRLLNSMKASAGKLILASDLIRSRLGYALCWTGIRLLTRSHICHVDGPLSVEGAFTMNEAAALVQNAQLTGAKVTKHWPERFLVSWTRP